MIKHWSESVFCPHCGYITLVPKEPEFYEEDGRIGTFHCIRCGEAFVAEAKFEAKKVKIVR